MTTIVADATCRYAESAKTQHCRGADGESGLPLRDCDVNQIVERKLGTANFRVTHWSLDDLGETNGYLGQYYTLTVMVRIDDVSRSLRFFAKAPPPVHSPQYDFLMRTNTFQKEIDVYREIVPRIGLGNGPKWAPAYYLGKSNAILVLEDAIHEGYVTPDKFSPFDEDHCVSMVTTLSTFHSRFLILDEKLRRGDGRTIRDLYGHLLKELAFPEGDELARRYLCSCIKGACTMVDYAERYTDEERSAMKDWIVRNVGGLPQSVRESKKFRNVVCHRDVWANNILFKRDPAGRPIGCYLIDFQFLRYSPPAVDFVLCLYLNTDRATRRRCHDRLVNVYLDTMRRELATEGLDADECLPREQFLECCRAFKDVALAYALANLQVMLLTKQAAEKYFVKSPALLEHFIYGEQRSELVIDQCRTMDSYRTRILDVLEEIREHLADQATGR